MSKIMELKKAREGREEKEYLEYLLLKHGEYHVKFKDDEAIIEVDDESPDGNVTCTYYYNTAVKNIVCTSCDGSGKELIDGLRGEAFTESDMQAPDWQDFSEGMAEGRYDQPCSLCKGVNVIKCADLKHTDAKTVKLLLRYFKYEVDEEYENYLAESRQEY